MADRTKKVDVEYRRHLARELQRIIDVNYDSNQTRAAKAIGISQSHLSHILAVEGRGPGLDVLLRIRRFTGRSLDDLLGLTPPREAEAIERMRLSLETDSMRIKAEAREAMSAVTALRSEIFALRTQAGKNIGRDSEPPPRSRKKGTG